MKEMKGCDVDETEAKRGREEEWIRGAVKRKY